MFFALPVDFRVRSTGMEHANASVVGHGLPTNPRRHTSGRSARERTITYVPPFDRCSREEDYRTAWAEFEKRSLSAEVGSLAGV